jgi:hypothetical protein
LYSKCVKTWADEQLAALRPKYPDWEIWFVPRYPTGQTWCARPVGARLATINVNSPEELVEAIRRQEQDALSGQP